MPGWTVRSIPPADCPAGEVDGLAVGVVELHELGGVAAGGGVLDLVDDHVGGGGLVARDPRIAGKHGSAVGNPLEQPVSLRGVALGLVVHPSGEVECDLGLGDADLGVVQRLHPSGREQVVDQRAQPAEVHGPQLGGGEQRFHDRVDPVAGLGRADEGAVHEAAVVAEGVVEVPREHRPATGTGILGQVEVLGRRVDVLDDRGDCGVVDHLRQVDVGPDVVALGRARERDAVQERLQRCVVTVVRRLLLEAAVGQRDRGVEGVDIGLEELVVVVALALAPGAVIEVEVVVDALEGPVALGADREDLGVDDARPLERVEAQHRAAVRDVAVVGLHRELVDRLDQQTRHVEVVVLGHLELPVRLRGGLGALAADVDEDVVVDRRAVGQDRRPDDVGGRVARDRVVVGVRDEPAEDRDRRGDAVLRHDAAVVDGVVDAGESAGGVGVGGFDAVADQVTGGGAGDGGGVGVGAGGGHGEGLLGVEVDAVAQHGAGLVGDGGA